MNLLQQSLLFVVILFGLALIGAFIYHLTPVLTPFVIAAVIAYLADPLVEYLSQGKWKMPRTLAVILVFSVMIILLFIVLFWLVPALQRQLIVLVAKIPMMIDWSQQVLLPQLVVFGIAPEDIGLNTLKDTISKHIPQVSQFAQWMWLTLFHSGLALFGWLMNILIVLVSTFYLLRDWRQILVKIQALLPSLVAPTVLRLARQCDVVLATFVRGQLSVMVTLALFYGVGLAFIGVHFSLLLGIMVGFLSIVPYLGSMIGLGVALGITYVQFHAWLPEVGVLVLFTVGHLLEGMVLTPWLIGDKLGLHPVVVIFAVLAGGHLLGFVGVVLALPLTAILVVLINELLHNLPGADLMFSSSSKGAAARGK